MRGRVVFLLAGLVALGCADPVRATGDASGVSVERARNHLTYLASDALQGRASGTRGYDEASEYVEEQLASYGLRPLFGSSYQQPFLIRTLEVEPEGSITLERPGGATRFPWLDGAALIEPGVGTHRGSGKRLVYVGLGIHEPEANWNDYAGVDLTDACAVVLVETPREMAEGLPERLWRRYQDHQAGGEYKLRALIEHGTDCALMITSGGIPLDWEAIIRDPKALKRPDLASPEGKKSLPEFWGIAIGAEATRELFRGQPHPAFPGGRPVSFEFQGVTLGYDVSVAVGKELKTANVAAYLPGTDSSVAEEVIVLSAHLDGQGMQGSSVLNAANDNAAAVAALLEAARVMATRSSRRSVVFLFPAAEEIGLLGSRYYVQQPPFPLEHVALNANMEMIGTPDRSRGEHFRVTARLTEELGDLADAVKRRHGGVTFDYALRVEGQDRSFRRADHVNFFLRGIPTLYFYGGNDANYHRPSDDIGAVDMNKVGTMAELLIALLEVADPMETLPRPEP